MAVTMLSFEEAWRLPKMGFGFMGGSVKHCAIATGNKYKPWLSPECGAEQSNTPDSCAGS